MADARAVVPAPDRAPASFGLFSLLDFRNNGRWLPGVTWEGASCGPASAYDFACTTEPTEITRPDRPVQWGQADAISVEGTFTCTPVGVSLAEIEDRAVADLQLHEEAAVETHLWDLLAADTDAVALTPLNGTPKAVLGALERHAALTYGYRGVIHLPRHLAPFFEGLLEVRGGQLVTFLGTPVSAGAGYGTEATADVYVTPALLAYRGEAQVIGAPEQMFDHSHNTLTAIAQREYLLGIDTCPIATAPVTITS